MIRFLLWTAFCAAALTAWLGLSIATIALAPHGLCAVVATHVVAGSAALLRYLGDA